MNFTSMFRFFPWLMLTPWLLYFVGSMFGLSTIYEKGRRERFIVAVVLIFVATFLLAVMIWPSSMKEMAEIIKANYYFPKEGG